MVLYLQALSTLIAGVTLGSRRVYGFGHRFTANIGNSQLDPALRSSSAAAPTSSSAQQQRNGAAAAAPVAVTVLSRSEPYDIGAPTLKLYSILGMPASIMTGLVYAGGATRRPRNFIQFWCSRQCEIRPSRLARSVQFLGGGAKCRTENSIHKIWTLPSAAKRSRRLPLRAAAPYLYCLALQHPPSGLGPTTAAPPTLIGVFAFRKERVRGPCSHDPARNANLIFGVPASGRLRAQAGGEAQARLHARLSRRPDAHAPTPTSTLSEPRSPRKNRNSTRSLAFPLPVCGATDLVPAS
ncbi:hypothetical protein C8R43DRAFT_1131755 [Mycena crocata]|nr:hypothetical protein C8R43DRAFT_1131755 [Mycena crocata]